MSASEASPAPRPVSLRHRLEYTAVISTGALVRSVPRRLALRIGAILGVGFYALDRPHRRLALANLARAFPRRSAAERKVIARAVFMHFGTLLVELLRFSALPPDEMQRSVVFEGEEHVRRAHASGKGALLFTGHFGFWELHAIAHGLSLYPMSRRRPRARQSAAASDARGRRAAPPATR